MLRNGTRHSPLHGPEALEDRTLLSTAAPGPLLDLSGLSVNPNAADPSHILVEYRSDNGPLATVPGTTLGQRLGLVSGLYEIDLAQGVSADQALAGYRSLPGVASAEPDFLMQVSGVPSDPRFSSQWDMRNTGQGGGRVGADLHVADAWNVTTGSRSMVVAVMDTGIDYTHPDLYRNIWINQGEVPTSRRAHLVDVDGDGLITFNDLNDARNQGPGKITDLNHDGYIDAGDLLAPMSKNAQGQDTGLGGWADGTDKDNDSYRDDVVGWNFVDNNNNPRDDNGHGTHVAGTIGATGNDGTGVAGINWKVQLMPMKFLGSNGNGSIGQFIAALNYAVAHGARISNNSWTGAGNSQVLLDAINNARAHGQIFVAAAGNEGKNNDTSPTYPASFGLDNVVSVAATDRYDRLAAFSNYGAHSVDLAAPGVDILSTVPNRGYASYEGTSMATPHVSGVLALVWSLHPSWNYRQVIDQVLRTTDKLPSLQGKTVTGGRLDAAAAVGVGSGLTVTVVSGPHVVTANFSGPATGRIDRVRLTFNQAVNVTTFTTADIHLTGPGGRAIGATGVHAVAGSGNKVFDVLFAAQTQVGSYQLHVGPNVRGSNGGLMTAYQTSFVIHAPPPVVVGPRVVSSAFSGPAAGRIDRVRLTFNQAVNVSTFTTTDIHLTGPGGRVIGATRVQAVAGSGNKVFDVFFATQTQAGTYQLRVGPDVRGSNGALMAAYQTSYVLPAPHPVVVVGPRVTVSTFSGPAAGGIDRVRVTFNQAVNVSTFTTTDIHLTGPGGRAIGATGVHAVAGSGNKVFDVLFATQTQAGSYQLHVGPDVRGSNGALMTAYQTTFALPAASTWTGGARVLRDVGSTASVLNIGPSQRIGTLSVRVDLSYTRDADAQLYLQAPDGTYVLLSRNRGGTGQNFRGTVFNDAAATPISAGRAPFTGSFRPETPLSALRGKNAQGTWRLWVMDSHTGSMGTLNNWSLTITPAVGTAGIASIATVAAPHSASVAPAAFGNHDVVDALFAAAGPGSPGCAALHPGLY